MIKVENSDCEDISVRKGHPCENEGKYNTLNSGDIFVKEEPFFENENQLKTTDYVDSEAKREMNIVYIKTESDCKGIKDEENKEVDYDVATKEQEMNCMKYDEKTVSQNTFSKHYRIQPRVSESIIELSHEKHKYETNCLSGASFEGENIRDNQSTGRRFEGKLQCQGNDNSSDNSYNTSKIMFRAEKLLKCIADDSCSLSNTDLKTKIKSKSKKLFKCPDCDFNATYKSRLRIHLRMHTGEKPFKCDHCDYTAARKINLESHIRVHTGDKPFKCTHCDFVTSHRSNLRNHVTIHTGEKPFRCSDCDYTTSRKSHLRLHIRSHTGEKPFKCSHCDYAASNTSTLQNHLRIHSGEKRFRCNHCDYTATYKSSLQNHIKIHG